MPVQVIPSLEYAIEFVPVPPATHNKVLLKPRVPPIYKLPAVMAPAVVKFRLPAVMAPAVVKFRLLAVMLPTVKLPAVIAPLVVKFILLAVTLPEIAKLLGPVIEILTL